MNAFMDFSPREKEGKRYSVLAVFGLNSRGDYVCLERLGAFEVRQNETLYGYLDQVRLDYWLNNGAHMNRGAFAHFDRSRGTIKSSKIELIGLLEFLDQINRAEQADERLEIYLPEDVSPMEADALLTAAGELMESIGYAYEPETEERFEEALARR